MNFINNIKSDLYKFNRSSLLLLHLLIPILGIVLFESYYIFSPWTEFGKVLVYIETLSITYPFLIGLISSMLVDQEQKAGNFQLILSTPTRRYVPHLSKLTLLILFGFLSSILSLVGFGILFRVLGLTTYTILFYLKMSLLLTISVLPLYITHYVIGFYCRKGINLSIGIIGSLLSALLLTGLGDRIWYFVPWGIAARFSSTLLTSTLVKTNFFQLNDILKGSVFICISCIVLITSLLLLSNRLAFSN